MNENIKDIVKLAVDLYNGKVENYSTEEGNEVLRKALIEANGGSSKLNYKAIRNGQGAELFAIIEEILKNTVLGGMREDNFFNTLVDLRNIAEGDLNEFVIEDSRLFVVDDTAEGTQGVRRQRLGAATTVKVPTVMRTVRIYEELSRVLSGRVDFAHMIDLVAESFRQKMMNDVYTLWSTATADDFGDSTGVFFPTAGAYDDDALLTLIEHVEAAAGGKTATIVGTKAALRPLIADIKGDDAKNTVDELGYVGKWFGSPVIAVPQTHKPGTTEFAISDKMISVIAGDEKPIKFVYEGDPIVIVGDPLANADLTQEYFYGERYGLAVAVAGGNSGIGRYLMT